MTAWTGSGRSTPRCGSPAMTRWPGSTCSIGFLEPSAIRTSVPAVNELTAQVWARSRAAVLPAVPPALPTAFWTAVRATPWAILAPAARAAVPTRGATLAPIPAVTAPVTAPTAPATSRPPSERSFSGVASMYVTIEPTAPERAPQAMAPTPVQPIATPQPTPTAMPTATPAISALCCSAQLTAVWKPDFALFHACAHQGPEPPPLFFGAALWGGSGLAGGWSGGGWAVGSLLGEIGPPWQLLTSSHVRWPVGSAIV